MKSEAALAVSYLRRTGQGDLYVGVPGGGVSRVHLADDDAKARFVTALLKAKCEPGEELELFGEPVAALAGPARARLRRRIAALSPIVGLITNLNVWENVSLAAAYHGTPPLEGVAAMAGDVLSAFGYEARPFLARLPDGLAPLEAKLAELIRLLAAAPELAVIDALQDGLSGAERPRAVLFESELRTRLPQATLLFVDSREEDS
jgi:predicted ABC-type transport system involved in lysophospholipase L1 biosynthesis ATPase subunit